MNNVELSLEKTGRGLFFIKEGDEQIAELVFSIQDDHLTVYHTEVLPEQEGKGLAKHLLDELVDYSRVHNLKVIPLCPYVSTQFRRHPAKYSDVWSK